MDLTLTCVGCGTRRIVEDKPFNGMTVVGWWNSVGKLCSTCRGAVALGTQAPLSDPAINMPGAAHKNAGDTETASKYAVMPRSGTLRMKVLDAIAQAPDGLTDHEISDVTGIYLMSAEPRRNELVKGGWVVDSTMRRPTPYGGQAIVWVLTARGRADLQAVSQGATT